LHSIAPVGAAWLKCLKERPDINLYDTDNRHPAYNGSFLSACVLFSTIFHRIPADNNIPSDMKAAHVDEYLKNIAFQVLKDTFNYTNLESVIPAISIHGNLLSAPGGYATYQWFSDLKLIPGANGSTYLATDIKPFYWVLVTSYKGCAFQSMPVQALKPDAIADIAGMGGLHIYPNPAIGIIHIPPGIYIIKMSYNNSALTTGIILR
jgi:hypothetical protein